MVLKLERALESWRAGKAQLAEPTPRASGLVGLGWGMRVCFYSNFLADADFAGPPIVPAIKEAVCSIPVNVLALFSAPGHLWISSRGCLWEAWVALKVCYLEVQGN